MTRITRDRTPYLSIIAFTSLIGAVLWLIAFFVGYRIGKQENINNTEVEIHSKEFIIPEYYFETDGINIDTIFVYRAKK